MTNGKEDVTYLIEDLIEAANKIGTKILNFTHYGFSPRKENLGKKMWLVNKQKEMPNLFLRVEICNFGQLNLEI